MSRPWWRDAICYQIYVRSFADADGDGIGDLAGVAEHLDHLVDLGVDALWLNPFYPSPQHDHGYDVADYRGVEPDYGTLATFDAMLAAAHDRGLRVLVDLVPNHTSSEHVWFQEALAAAPGSPERERYLFRDGEGDQPPNAVPPNNWLSIFGGGAWTRVPDGQWYLHLFDAHQPDLNWRNPEVHAEFESVLRFWLDRGADGFRIDVAHGLYKVEGLPDAEDPVACIGQSAPLGSPMWFQPETHDVYRAWRRVVDAYPGDPTLISEAWCPTPEETAKFVRPGELQQTFGFHLLQASWGATAFRGAITATLDTLASVGASPTWVLSNHDVIRHPTRYGGGPTGVARARAATAMMLALPGSCYLYQGEELGLEQVDVPPESRQDPEYLNGRGTGRDGCRVPLPWSGEVPPFGFGPATGQPWLPQPAEWAPLTVAAEATEPDSTLTFYRTALAARRELLATGWGDEPLQWEEAADDVVAFRRGSIRVFVNCGTDPMPLPDGEVVLASGPVQAGSLPPDSAVWLR